MKHQTKREIIFGLIGGLIGFFLIVLPLLRLFNRGHIEEKDEPIVVYFKWMR